MSSRTRGRQPSISLATDFDMPLDAVTETFAILGRRGMGKTHTASVLAEQVLGAGQPAVIVDPLGVWWGLRSSADGKNAGLPVVIFGGDHADVPLSESSGAIIAEAVVTDRFGAILDLSLLSKSASRRFMTEFLEALYHRNRDALHVFVDEADLFAPQRNLAPDSARLLGAMEDLVRRGRARGLGTTLITQRPAVLNKDVLSQASTLIALGMTGKHDVAAIDEWVRLHADEDEAKALKASLPSLPVGTAWVWSPGWLGVLEKVKIAKRSTFDSSATPKVGQARVVPKRMAEIDLAALGAKIETAADQVKTNDPKTLRAKIAKLERELAEAGSLAPAETVVERVEVPVLDDEVVDRIESRLASVEEALRASEIFADLRAALDGIESELSTLKAARGRLEMSASPHRPIRRSTNAQQSAPKPRPSQATFTSNTAPEPVDGDNEVKLKAGARRILETFARQHPQRLTKAQLATLAKFKVTGGTFQTYWGQLRRAGFLDERGSGRDADYTLTPEGFDFIGMQPREPQTRDETIAAYSDVLKAGARQMLDIVVDVWPDSIGRDDLADAVGMTASGGTFQTYLGTLRRNGLIQIGQGAVHLSDFIGDLP